MSHRNGPARPPICNVSCRPWRLR